MPYLIQETRERIEQEITKYGLTFIPTNAAEVNYITSCLISNYLRDNGKSYAALNEMVGALECCKLELQRVLIAPYEAEKEAQNGGVY